MLSKRVLASVFRTQLTVPNKWLSITVRLKTNSSSSDSSSSDSDSDNEKGNQKQLLNQSKTNYTVEKDNKLEKQMINRTTNKTQSSSQVNVAMNPRKQKVNKKKAIKQTTYDHLSEAATNIVNRLGGNKEQTKSLLLGRLENKKDESKISVDINKLISNMDTEHEEGQRIISDIRKKALQKTRFDLSKDARQNYMHGKNTSYSRRPEQQMQKYGDPLFANIATPDPDVPRLETWNLLNDKFLSLLTSHAPENVFQEMIQWTEEGKLWKFPIDNEQGMEEERNVHFSEHVFMERHLKGWCPQKGPIRHFMELVCVGLSKNPYMTVKEKVDHIMWYKQFFEEKKDLLTELGAIETASSETVKKLET